MFVLKLLKNKELNKFNLKLLILALSVSSFIPKIAFYNQIDNFTPNTILIKYKSAASPIAIKINSNNFYEGLNYYQRLPSVEFAEPDFIYQASIIPSDTYFSHQWHLQKIKATTAWNDIRESPKAVIAILDSGVQIDHPDLRDNIWVNSREIAGNKIDDDKNGFIDDLNGWDFINDAPDPAPKFKEGFTEDGINHGTIIAGIAAAAGNNATGIAGVTWKARLMPLKVLDDKGEGNSSKVVKAIDYAIANGANIINLSFVGFSYSRSLDEAIKRAYDAGIIVVSAGGNELNQGQGNNLDETPMYPVNHDGPNGENRVIGVAATDTMDQKTFFSGFSRKFIDIAAPGVSIFSTVVYSPANSIKGHFFDKYYDGYWSGTSVAVPMVSASLALIEAANPSLNRQEVLEILFSATDDISRLNPAYEKGLGSGRINLLNSLVKAQSLLKNKTERILIVPQGGYQSLLKISDQDGKAYGEFLIYDKKFRGGVNLAAGDVNGDGKKEIITAPGAGGGPHIKIYNQRNELIGQWLAFDKNFRGGVRIASADVNHDGLEEIIAVQASGGDSEVRIFNNRGNLLGSFYAYDHKFKGGLNLATGDIDGDGEAEIVTGLGAGKIPEVRIFKAIGVLQGQFLAYPKSFLGGVRVLIADIKGGTQKHRAQIVTAPEGGGGPHVKFFDARGNLLWHFFAFNSKARLGVNLAVSDLDNDGLDEIITAAGPGGAPHVRVFKSNGTIIGSFYAYDEKMSGGVNVAGIRL